MSFYFYTANCETKSAKFLFMKKEKHCVHLKNKPLSYYALKIPHCSCTFQMSEGEHATGPSASTVVLAHDGN